MMDGTYIQTQLTHLNKNKTGIHKIKLQLNTTPAG
jgi:hypothetical protein